MNRFRWFFMSKYKKLLYSIKCAKSNKQRLHLENGIVLDFSDGTEIKVYRVTLEDHTVDSPFYMVDAPNEYIARWCGANLYNNDYYAFMSARDMNAEEFKLEEEQQ